MNILQLSKFYPPTKGGIELVAEMFSRAHMDLGDNVTVISFGDKTKSYFGRHGEKVEQVNRDLFFMSTPFHFGLFFQFKRFIEEHSIEKIYVHLPNPYMHHVVHYYRNFLKKKKIRIAAIYHSDLVNQKRVGPLYDLYFIKTAGFYDEFICSSGELWDSSLVLSSFPDEKKRVIPFCTSSNNRFLHRNKFKGQFVAIGRMVPYKGFEFLIDAFNNSNYTLKIIGDGPLRQRLEERAGDNVTLYGEVTEDEKQSILNMSDILIMSSINRAEAYGMTIVEAFESGLPVIASDIRTGVRFLVKDGERGFLFPIKSKEKLIESMARFENEPDLLGEISANCRKFFDEELSYSQFKKRIEKLI